MKKIVLSLLLFLPSFFCSAQKPVLLKSNSIKNPYVTVSKFKINLYPNYDYSEPNIGDSVIVRKIYFYDTKTVIVTTTYAEKITDPFIQAANPTPDTYWDATEFLDDSEKKEYYSILKKHDIYYFDFKVEGIEIEGNMQKKTKTTVFCHKKTTTKK